MMQISLYTIRLSNVLQNNFNVIIFVRLCINYIVFKL